MLRTYRIYNSMVRFLKYEFYNKLLGDVTLLRVTPCVTWTQPNPYIDIYISSNYSIVYFVFKVNQFTKSIFTTNQ